MKPKDAAAILQAITNTGKTLTDWELNRMSSCRNRVRMDQNLEKKQEKDLLDIYQRVTECRRIKYGSVVRP